MPICGQCQQEFEITAEDRAFYSKLNVPAPTTCLVCREKARFVFRNERYYYQRSCDLCKKSIISVYDPAKTKNVYCNACFWSDKWDTKKYGRDFDFSKPFFEQYNELAKEAPKLAMMNDNVAGSENCEYTYDFAKGKNAYLVIGSWHVQDSMYGFQTNYVKDCFDNYYVNNSELIYNSIFCERCYACQECMQCSESSNCIFGFDLKGCQDCLFCAGLRHKQYYILNKKYGKEEYFKKLSELRLDSWKNREIYRKQFAEFILKIPRKFANLPNCEDCTGDNVWNSKNSKECFNHRNLHSCKWMTNGYGAKDCYECYSTSTPELCYHCITPDESYAVIFSVYCWKSQNIAYSDNCHSSHDLFGCIGMKREKYCILNKEYSREEYAELKAKIVLHMTENGEWGEFFPYDVSPFAYNETSAQEWHPLDQKTALKFGYRWQEILPGSFGKETVTWNNVPDSIEDISSNGGFDGQHVVFNEIFPCENCNKNFKILQREFNFYKTQKIPLPHLCIDCRYLRRKNMMNPRQLWDRQCTCKISAHGHDGGCNNKFQTTYSPERPEEVFCEKCYEKEIGS